MDEKKDFQSLARFVFEVGALKNTPRSGWLKVGIKNPESVAEHTMRVSLIAFLISFLETGDLDRSSKAVVLSVFHDLAETRTTDLHRLSRRYVRVDKEKAVAEQMELLPASIVSSIQKMKSEVDRFVKDADKLELLFQAIEYSRVCPDALEYIKNLNFETQTAKKIAEAARKLKPWWVYFE